MTKKGKFHRVGKLIPSLAFATVFIGLIISPGQIMSKGRKTKTTVKYNKLIHEKSPYLATGVM